MQASAVTERPGYKQVGILHITRLESGCPVHEIWTSAKDFGNPYKKLPFLLISVVIDCIGNIIFSIVYCLNYPIPVLDFTHAHLHKCMHFFLCASKISNLHAHCACNFLVTNFNMNRNSKKLLISTNFQGIKSLCFLYFAICVVFSLLRPSFVHVPTMLCK